MSDMNPDGFEVVRAIGATCGAILSLVYDNPATFRELLYRFTFSTMSGFIFAFVAIERAGWPETSRHYLAAAALVGALSWLVAGVFARILRGMDKWPAK